MSTNSYWLSYDDREDRRRPRRKWPWVLLALLFVAIAAGLVTAATWEDGSETVDLTQPAAIQEALPALLADNITVLYVVDDSGSMAEKLLPLYEALHEVAGKHTEHSEIAMMMFGQENEMLFDFSEPSSAPWEAAIPSFTASGGHTFMYTALGEALRTMPSRPTCWEETKWVFFSETFCRERRIVLMSDGMASDPHLAQEVMPDLVMSQIPVDTVAFGADADRVGLRTIADATGGRFVEAH